jgi:hypothetical protein
MFRRQILMYLLEYPAAADSMEGIRLWWLREAGKLQPSDLRSGGSGATELAVRARRRAGNKGVLAERE